MNQKLWVHINKSGQEILIIYSYAHRYIVKLDVELNVSLKLFILMTLKAQQFPLSHFFRYQIRGLGNNQ